MSRSYKKNGFTTICKQKDKDFRKIYHHSARRRVKELLLKESFENIINNKIDRMATYADKFNWSSDGGAYFSDNISTIRKEFDEEVFGIGKYKWFRKNSKNIWERYIKNDTSFDDYDFLGFCFNRLNMPDNFSNSEELIDFLRNNEEKIISLMFKMRYRK